MSRFLVLPALLLLASLSFAQDGQIPVKTLTAPDVNDSSECLDSYGTRSKESFLKLRRNAWIRDQKSDTAIVFVHGVWSDNVDAWLTQSAPCVYWPDLLASDVQTFGDADIYLAGYYSKADSGTYSIEDAAEELYSALSVPLAGRTLAPLRRKTIIFLAHSLGGIVVRQALQAHRDAFSGHRIGIVLMGSPARGSDYATIVDWFSAYYKNSLIEGLQANSGVLSRVDEASGYSNRRMVQLAMCCALSNSLNHDFLPSKDVFAAAGHPGFAVGSQYSCRQLSRRRRREIST